MDQALRTEIQAAQGWMASCILHPLVSHRLPPRMPSLTRNTPWAYRWIPNWIPLTIFSRAHLGIPKLAIRAMTGTAKNLKGRQWVCRDTIPAFHPTPWPQIPCYAHTHTHTHTHPKWVPNWREASVTFRSQTLKGHRNPTGLGNVVRGVGKQ